MTEVTPEQAMDAAVRIALASLSDGAVARQVLEDLWRTAYAAGVRTGRQPPPVPAVPGQIAGTLAAWSDHWQWSSTAVFLARGKPVSGQRFTYGGCDPARPGTERKAITDVASTGAVMMTLQDTGERIRVPVMCWMREGWASLTEGRSI